MNDFLFLNTKLIVAFPQLRTLLKDSDMSKKKLLTNDNEVELPTEIEEIIFSNFPSKIKEESY